MSERTRILPLSAIVDSNYLAWLDKPLGKPLLRDLQALYGSDLAGIPWDAPVTELFRKGHEPGRFNTYTTEALMLLNRTRNAFHNMRHGQRVGCNGEDGLKAIETIFGALPGELFQAAMWGYAMHDYGHCGAAFFALKEGRLPRGAHPDMALEVFTAYKLDKLLTQHPHFYSPLARLVANYIVISSAFGAMHPEHGEHLKLHLVKPQAIFGTLMRVSDVLPTSDFITQINDEADLLYREIPATPVPATWRGYAGSRERFLEYVERTLDEFDKAVQAQLPPQAVPFSLSSDLGWRAQLTNAKNELERARRIGFRMAVLRSTINVHGDALT